MTAQRRIHLLLVEDHPAIVDGIRDYLDPARYEVEAVGDGETGLARALVGVHDLLVVDLMLPRLDGLALCRAARAAGITAPVLMLTARDTLTDKLEGFRAGTDDYLTKPFAVEELESRLLALYRRGGGARPPAARAAGLELDFERRLVLRDGTAIEVPPTVFRMLAILIRRHPAVVTRDELERLLWGDQPPGSDTLRTHMSTLRRLVEKPFGRPVVENVYGTGYRLVE
jgi:DNA-binding response OmpR family regulator